LTFCAGDRLQEWPHSGGGVRTVEVKRGDFWEFFFAERGPLVYFWHFFFARNASHLHILRQKEIASNIRLLSPPLFDSFGFLFFHVAITVHAPQGTPGMLMQKDGEFAWMMVKYGLGHTTAQRSSLPSDDLAVPLCC